MTQEIQAEHTISNDSSSPSCFPKYISEFYPILYIISNMLEFCLWHWGLHKAVGLTRYTNSFRAIAIGDRAFVDYTFGILNFPAYSAPFRDATLSKGIRHIPVSFLFPPSLHCKAALHVCVSTNSVRCGDNEARLYLNWVSGLWIAGKFSTTQSWNRKRLGRSWH